MTDKENVIASNTQYTLIKEKFNIRIVRIM